MDNSLDPKLCLENVRNETLSAFSYLKKANECLSSPDLVPIGQEFIIRALEALPLFKKQTSLLQNLLRSAGLYPYLKKYFTDLSPEKEFVLDVYRSNFDDNFIFHSMQARVFNLLSSGKNVVLSAPTSMGKSAIVDALIAEKKFKSIVIVVPTIALIDETRRRIHQRFGNEYQIIHHGSQAKRKDKVIYIFTQERVNERDDLKNIDLFIIDEFYKLADTKDELSRPRAFALNIALSKLLTVSKQFYMIGPYIDAIQGMNALKREFTFIPSDFKTVALNVYKYDIASNDIDSKNKELERILESHNGQTIIYCKSSNSIAKVIRFLGSLDSLQERKFLASTDVSLKKYYKWLKRNYGADWGCTQALANGIGIHHGALPRAIQQKTVELFNTKQIQFLLCTSTMIEGVNTSAENIVIYDNRNGTPKIDSFTHKNISGRAGRMGQYLVGNVFCLEELPEQESQVVSLPLGQQDDDSPINLLAGIQPEHLSELGSQSLIQFAKNSDVPMEIVRKHLSYNVEDLENAYELVTELSITEMEQIASVTKPKRYQLGLLTNFIKTVESRVLARQQLHFEDSDELYKRLGRYIYADNHTAYIRKQIEFIYNSREGDELRSDATDRELNIVRNIFKHAVARALSLLEDLLNHEFKSLGLPPKANLGWLVHIFENSHLPSSFSALEEMGIPIETLEKLVTARLSEADIDTLVRYLRIYHRYLHQLNSVDQMFIEQAIY
ncbi:TPA: DEAD/DEAH box helicase [Vibrio vulnificus]|nr:DEAD/DEAH box helicase [Vibrio vulnificus]EHZ7120479.1 DEAD/DEAH box helicase [Vibrio vulnificus]EIJ0944630.1 DEAD/DEAH box helicase [Vibrio vulnificus]EJD0673139.1 DEAD/DEAH box helicase [Vibrio vulnificus]EJZ7970470.1 DEAD/DEAH box helicase [Vibrio vulnificus]